MRSCDHYQAQLLEHLYGLLEPGDARALQEHVEQCGDCRAALARAEAQQQLIAAAARADGEHQAAAVGNQMAGRVGFFLWTDDFNAAHERMNQLGVDVDAGIARIGSPLKARIGAVEQAEPQPPMFWFRDPDGNLLALMSEVKHV